jgi:hypothetical protein
LAGEYSHNGGGSLQVDTSFMINSLPSLSSVLLSIHDVTQGGAISSLFDVAAANLGAVLFPQVSAAIAVIRCKSTYKLITQPIYFRSRSHLESPNQ